MNKFGAIKTSYKNEIYDSKAESRMALHLDLLKNARDPKERVLKWERQIPFDLVVNGEKICKYICDFRVEYADKRVEFLDVKGYKKGSAYSVFRIKQKLMLACHGITVKIV